MKLPKFPPSGEGSFAILGYGKRGGEGVHGGVYHVCYVSSSVENPPDRTPRLLYSTV